jgi:hypothetical protein
MLSEKQYKNCVAIRMWEPHFPYCKITIFLLCFFLLSCLNIWMGPGACERTDDSPHWPLIDWQCPIICTHLASGLVVCRCDKMSWKKNTWRGIGCVQFTIADHSPSQKGRLSGQSLKQLVASHPPSGTERRLCLGSKVRPVRNPGSDGKVESS